MKDFCKSYPNGMSKNEIKGEENMDRKKIWEAVVMMAIIIVKKSKNP